METATINVENAKKLLDSIVAHGEKHFDMSHWIYNPLTGEDNGLDEAGTVDLDDCGTTACAAGHAAAIMAREGCPMKRIEDISKWLGMSKEGYLFRLHLWSGLGEIGKTACNIAYDRGDYAGIIYLLENLIKEAQNG